MGLNTRSKNRKLVCDGSAEYSIDSTSDKSFKLNVSKESIGPDAKKSIKSQLIDISIRGCALDSSYMIPPGIRLHIKIDPCIFIIEPDNAQKEPMKFVGEVRSCVMQSAGHYRLGIEFKEFNKADVDIINNFVTSKEQRKAPRWEIGN